LPVLNVFLIIVTKVHRTFLEESIQVYSLGKAKI